MDKNYIPNSDELSSESEEERPAKIRRKPQDETTTTPAQDDVTTPRPAQDGVTTTPPAQDGVTTTPPAQDGVTTTPPTQDGVVTTTPTKKGKKRKRSQQLWKRNVTKYLRNEGKEYVTRGKNKNVREARRVKQPCGNKCRLKCNETISEEQRQQIFDSYWVGSQNY